MAGQGYFGLFAASFLGATIVPFSSDVVVVGMVYAGYYNIGWIIIIATIGNWLGGLSSYYLGYLGKWQWLERYFGIKHQQLVQTQYYLNKYGLWLAFFSWLPFLGDLFCAGMGFFKTNLRITALLMLLGKLLKYAAVAWLTLKGIEI
ncbi:MAG: DedA family protein [Sphingobacteriales bacterium]|nr:DedA family protein [Sphingobacteriales bacterium]